LPQVFAVVAHHVTDISVGQGVSAVGTTWNIEWVKIDDPEAAVQSTFEQGLAKGAARFRRLEGAWWGASTGYFLATTGGTIAC